MTASFLDKLLEDAPRTWLLQAIDRHSSAVDYVRRITAAKDVFLSFRLY